MKRQSETHSFLEQIEKLAAVTGCSMRTLIIQLLDHVSNEGIPKIRFRYIGIQSNICAVCKDLENLLVNDEKLTHVHHKRPKSKFADEIINGRMSLEVAWKECWVDSNLEVVHTQCHKAHKSNHDEVTL